MPATLSPPESQASFLPTWMRGRWHVDLGSRDDYRELSRHHYLAGPPATWQAIVAVRHGLPEHPLPRLREPGQLAAVGVLSWPTALSKPRRRRFDLGHLGYGEQIRFANDHLRTISRVIVRPAYRGCGLARVVIAELLQRCPTRYVEATARMAEMHPMFERAGMTRLDAIDGETPYFWFDRGAEGGAA